METVFALKILIINTQVKIPLANFRAKFIDIFRCFRYLLPYVSYSIMFQNLPHTSFDLQSDYVSQKHSKKLYSFLNDFQSVVNSSDIFPKFLWPLAVLSNI